MLMMISLIAKSFDEVLSKLDKTISIYLQETGDEIIKFLQSSGAGIDLVFLDLNMPEKNGFDVLRDIKEMNNPDLPPVVVFSTSTDNQHNHLSKQLGAKMYIEKPSTTRLMYKRSSL